METVSTAKAAQRFNVTSATILRWIKDGKLEGAYKLSPSIKNSVYIIPTSAIEKLEQEKQDNE